MKNQYHELAGQCIMGFLCILTGFLLAVGPASVSTHPEDILRQISDLRGKDFGHNYPRHGLNLLYWFSHDFISFDNNNNMQAKKDPKSGAFGFHYYNNTENLLQPVDSLSHYSYYIVGNLFGNKNLHLEAEKLPDYVMAEYLSSNNLDSSDQNNRDRIIVRRDRFGSIDQVYITQHYNFDSSHRNKYDPNNTYSISPELLRDIGNMQREEFLKLFGTRTKSHYAMCHPDRQEQTSNQNCDHTFSKGSRTSPLLAPGTLVGMCCTAVWLILGSS
ncbi:hypothetical protein GN956_G19213 [Arapaima gigas]